MVEEINSFQKMSVLPNEKDFVDAIVSLRDHQRPTFFLKAKASTLKVKRKSYVESVKQAQKIFLGKLSKVWDEFTPLDTTHPLHDDLVHQRFDIEDLMLALEQLDNARILIEKIGEGYVQLLNNKSDCVSRDQCKDLKVAALGCMFTVAMRCIPSFAYLDKVRAQATEKILEDENAATLTNKKHAVLLAVEDCTVPLTCGFDIQNVAGFVDPKTLRWLEELEREDGPWLQDVEVDSAELSQTHKEHLS